MKRIYMALAAMMLALPIFAQDEEVIVRPSLSLFGDGTYSVAEGVQPARVPQSIAEALAALPALPTAEQLSSTQTKEIIANRTYQPYILALEHMTLDVTKENLEIQQRLNAVRNKQAQRGQKAMQQYNSNVNAGLMHSQQEMMELYMSGAINEKMSDAQMMDVMAGKFAQKWGVSKEEYLKIINLAQRNEKEAAKYMQTNHPDLYKRLYAANAGFDTQEIADDSRDERFQQILDELQKLMEQFNAAVGSYKGFYASGNNGLNGLEYDKLLEDLRKDWENSDEAKQIDEIENKLWKRVEEWMATLNTYDGEVDYPAWWVADRKKENALMNQWNRRNAVKWLKIAEHGDNLLKPIFKKVAALETENEVLGHQGDTENVIYLNNKLQINMFKTLLVHLTYPIQDAFRFPCLDPVPEAGKARLGKG